MRRLIFFRNYVLYMINFIHKCILFISLFSIGARAEWPTPKSNHPRTFNRTNRRDVERVANESACTGNAATSNGDG